MIRKLLFVLLILVTVNANAQLKVYDKFEDFQGKYLLNRIPDTTYVINFWATWCRPCIQELPFFDSLTANYKNDKIKVVLVSLDVEDRIEDNLIPFIKRKNIQSEVVVLTAGKQNNWIDLVDPNWSGAIPITLIFGGSNKLFFEKSYHSYSELETDVLKIHDKTE